MSDLGDSLDKAKVTPQESKEAHQNATGRPKDLPEVDTEDDEPEDS